MYGTSGPIFLNFSIGEDVYQCVVSGSRKAGSLYILLVGINTHCLCGPFPCPPRQRNLKGDSLPAFLFLAGHAKFPQIQQAFIPTSSIVGGAISGKIAAGIFTTKNQPSQGGKIPCKDCVTMNWIPKSEMDSFFNQLTDCFVEILEDGLAFADLKETSFGSSNVDFIFNIGMECIKSAFHPDVTGIILDTKISLILSEGNYTEKDVFEMHILKKVMIAFQNSDIESFSILNHQIGSTAPASYNDIKLESII